MKTNDLKCHIDWKYFALPGFTSKDLYLNLFFSWKKISLQCCVGGMVWGGRREEGSGWGTHVYLWWIHFDIWQN